MKRLFSHISVLVLAFVSTASLALAQSTYDIEQNPLSSFIRFIIQFINSVLVPLVFAIAFIVFIWGVFQAFIVGGANEEKRDEGKKLVMWGLIALFVMSSLWGIVNLFVGTFGFGGQNAPCVPTFDSSEPCVNSQGDSSARDCLPGSNNPDCIPNPELLEGLY